ncbi:MAG: glycerol-3-phosphate 1-O-acyltransferase PlsY [Thermodesulfobacteriota bacterium]
MLLVAVILLAYLAGAIPTGLLVARAAGVDIRHQGSGNIGATNVTRALGRASGLVTLAGDIVKAVLPMLVAGWLAEADQRQLWLAAAGGAAFLGHCYPVYLGFKGGKGVATALGVFLVLAPLAVLAEVALFAVVVWRTGFVSAGSLAAAGLLPILTWLDQGSVLVSGLAILVAAVVVAKHRDNIRRLWRGEEKPWRGEGRSAAAGMEKKG